MARELDTDSIPPPRVPKQVKWAQYDTGKPWLLKRGEDFQQVASNAGNAAVFWGRRYDREVSFTAQDEDTLVIYIHPRPEDQV